MNCRQFKEIIDSYLAGELLVETNHEVLRHLEDCAACRRTLSAQRDLNARVRSAVKNAPNSQINPAFARKLEASLRQSALPHPTFWEKMKAASFIKSPVWSAAAIGAAACLLIGIFFGVNRLRQSSGESVAVRRAEQTNQPLIVPGDANQNQPQITEAAWREMSRTAIGDHENCALHFRLQEKPISLDEAAKRFGAFYKDFDKAVEAALQNGEQNEKADEIEILAAHSCLYNGRRFAHVVLRKGKNTISVLVTDANSSAGTDNSIIAAESSSGSENLQVAGFRQQRYAVFVVSDLNAPENQKFAARIAPAVRRHLDRTAA